VKYGDTFFVEFINKFQKEIRWHWPFHDGYLLVTRFCLLCFWCHFSIDLIILWTFAIIPLGSTFCWCGTLCSLIVTFPYMPFISFFHSVTNYKTCTIGKLSDAWPKAKLWHYTKMDSLQPLQRIFGAHHGNRCFRLHLWQFRKNKQLSLILS
jgi:hypothetical protein